MDLPKDILCDGGYEEWVHTLHSRSITSLTPNLSDRTGEKNKGTERETESLEFRVGGLTICSPNIKEIIGIRAHPPKKGAGFTRLFFKKKELYPGKEVPATKVVK
jgi:hypothetical protein